MGGVPKTTGATGRRKTRRKSERWRAGRQAQPGNALDHAEFGARVSATLPPGETVNKAERRLRLLRNPHSAIGAHASTRRQRKNVLCKGAEFSRGKVTDQLTTFTSPSSSRSPPRPWHLSRFKKFLADSGSQGVVWGCFPDYSPPDSSETPERARRRLPATGCEETAVLTCWAPDGGDRCSASEPGASAG